MGHNKPYDYNVTYPNNSLPNQTVFFLQFIFNIKTLKSDERMKESSL